MTETIVVLCTLPDAAQAAALGRTLVEEKLAACVNLVPSLRSIYSWQGKLCDEAEVLCLIKTTQARFAALRARICALHPYQVPEVIALAVVDGHRPYLDWVRDSTSAAG
ncbi:MAG TPA: divalent-cation tolerance protein CutA [Polyangia bacterium]|nr:divalent-cation tolerance protein CutA [Polyangia bacterium]